MVALGLLLQQMMREAVSLHTRFPGTVQPEQTLLSPRLALPGLRVHVKPEGSLLPSTALSRLSPGADQVTPGTREQFSSKLLFKDSIFFI